MAKIEGLVEGQDPATPFGELLIKVGEDAINAELTKIATDYGVPLRMLLGQSAEPRTATRAADEQAWQERLVELQKETDENIACRNAWMVSDRAVPFPDYWAGWQAALVLIAQRSELEADRRRYYEHLADAQHENTVALFQDEIAKRDAKINKLLQPTLKGEAFKKLRLENERLADALLYVADNCSDQEMASYASNVLNGTYL